MNQYAHHQDNFQEDSYMSNDYDEDEQMRRVLQESLNSHGLPIASRA
jgi:hypothetical protein